MAHQRGNRNSNGYWGKQKNVAQTGNIAPRHSTNSIYYYSQRGQELEEVGEYLLCMLTSCI
ncbi:hypothetical protein M5D96_011996 [Drosophila gunungcola]|uniref:Uncharacterized protein n=1 Tax=Drosophila gunungcola TaxID=103775 RepID=A0A9P9YE13_9MUSC|nr:hypothetical protein M5D96_011996 [Drosophila gunungcola]